MTQTVIPQLRMLSAAISRPFYENGLGFSVDWQHQFGPGFPLFLQLTRAGQTLFLTEHAGDCHVGGTVYFKVTDVDALFREFIGRGVVRPEPASNTPWGTREMSFMDPDGNRLRFATHPDEREADEPEAITRADMTETSMEQAHVTPLPPVPGPSVSPIIQSAARWFWWIAGLSLVNIVMSRSGSHTSFVMGLGSTTLADSLLQGRASLGYAVDALALALFVLLGIKAREGQLWAFYAGIILYALDGLIFVLVRDWMPVAFHGLALFYLARGAIALIAARQQAASQTT